MSDTGTQKYSKQELESGKKPQSQEQFTPDQVEKLADLFGEETAESDGNQDTGEFMPVPDEEDTGDFSPVKHQE